MLIFLFWCLTAIAANVSFCSEGVAASKADSLPRHQEIATSENAQSKALRYFGISDISEFEKEGKITCQLVSLEDHISPFVHNRINDHSVWQVKIEGVEIPSHRTPIIRDFEILIDPSDGSLLKIYSLSPKTGSSDTLPKPSAREAEEYLKSIQFSYSGIPLYEPDISFMEAITNCVLDPASAKEIHAYLVDHDLDKGREDDSWLIILRGTELLLSLSGRAQKGEIPDNLRNKVMCEIDAQTGSLRYYGTPPQRIK